MIYRQQKYIFLFCTFILGAIFLKIVLVRAFNAPIADDFDIFLHALSQMKAVSSLNSKLLIVFEPHNEHLLVLSQDFNLVSYKLLGSVNFTVLIMLGILALPLTLAILCRLAHLSGRYRYLSLIPISIFVFMPIYGDAMLWATAAIQNLWVFPFALLALYYGTRGKGFLLSLVFASLALLTQANGLLILPVLTFLSFIQRRLLCSLLYAMLTFLGLAWFKLNIKSHIGPTSSLQEFIDYTLSFLGSAFAFNHHSLALIIGSAIVISTGYVFLSGRYRDEHSIALFGFLLFIILTAVSNAYSRSSMGYDFAFTQPRYRVVSLLSIVACYLIFLRHNPKLLDNFAMPSYITVGALALWTIVVYTELPGLDERLYQAEESILRWQQSGSGLAYPAEQRANTIMQQAIKDELYHPPFVDPIYYVSQEVKPCPRGIKDERLNFTIAQQARNNDYLLVVGHIVYAGVSAKAPNKTNIQTYAMISHNNETRCFEIINRPHIDLLLSNREPRNTHSNFLALIPQELIPISFAAEEGNTVSSTGLTGETKQSSALFGIIASKTSVKNGIAKMTYIQRNVKISL